MKGSQDTGLNARKLVKRLTSSAFVYRRNGIVHIKRLVGERCEKCKRWNSRYEIVGSGVNAAQAWYAAAVNLGLINKGAKNVRGAK